MLKVEILLSMTAALVSWILANDLVGVQHGAGKHIETVAVWDTVYCLRVSQHDVPIVWSSFLPSCSAYLCYENDVRFYSYLHQDFSSSALQVNISVHTCDEVFQEGVVHHYHLRHCLDDNFMDNSYCPMSAGRLRLVETTRYKRTLY